MACMRGHFFARCIALEFLGQDVGAFESSQLLRADTNFPRRSDCRSRKVVDPKYYAFNGCRTFHHHVCGLDPLGFMSDDDLYGLATCERQGRRKEPDE